MWLCVLIEGHQDPRNNVGPQSPAEHLLGFEMKPYDCEFNALTHKATFPQNKLCGRGGEILMVVRGREPGRMRWDDGGGDFFSNLPTVLWVSNILCLCYVHKPSRECYCWKKFFDFLCASNLFLIIFPSEMYNLYQ